MKKSCFWNLILLGLVLSTTASVTAFADEGPSPTEDSLPQVAWSYTGIYTENSGSFAFIWSSDETKEAARENCREHAIKACKALKGHLIGDEAYYGLNNYIYVCKYPKVQ